MVKKALSLYGYISLASMDDEESLYFLNLLDFRLLFHDYDLNHKLQTDMK